MAMGLGPVFAMEWVTTARRWQGYAGRSAFVGVLLLGLASVWMSSVWGRPPLTIGEAAGVGRGFFAAIALVQIVSILLVGPTAMAGAICQEKARGNLGLLLLTDLSDAEIVLGKLGARLVPVAALVFCGLPVLALGTLLGGIDPLALFGLLLISIGVAALGASIAFTLSVWGTRAHEVLLATFAVYLVWLLGLPVWEFFTWFRGFPPLPRWAMSAHPTFLAFAPYVRPARVSILDYLGFLAGSLAVSAGLIALAIRRIRAVVVRQASGGAGRVATRGRSRGPDLDRSPILWYEWHRKRPTPWLRALIRFNLVISVVFSALAVEDSLRPNTPSPGWFPSFVNAFQVAIGMMLLVVPAALATAEERSRGSLDILLTTPIASSSVVLAKWWGVYRQVPTVVALPTLVASVLAGVREGRGPWGCVALIVAEILAMGAFWTSLGLAVSTWVPRVGRAVSTAVSLYVLGVLALPVLAMSIFSGGGPLGHGLAMGSPFYGLFDLTIGIVSPHDVAHLARWGLGWIAFHLVAAGLLLLATLATFNARLGRIPERSRPRKYAPSATVPPRRRRGLTVRGGMALVAVLAGLLGLGDAVWLAPYRREHPAAEAGSP